MSEDLRREQDEINAEDHLYAQNKLHNLSKSFADLYCQVTELKVRLAKLEAKEEQRAKDEFAREQALDFKDSIGQGEY